MPKREQSGPLLATAATSAHRERNQARTRSARWRRGRNTSQESGPAKATCVFCLGPHLVGRISCRICDLGRVCRRALQATSAVPCSRAIHVPLAGLMKLARRSRAIALAFGARARSTSPQPLLEGYQQGCGTGARLDRHRARTFSVRSRARTWLDRESRVLHSRAWVRRREQDEKEDRDEGQVPVRGNRSRRATPAGPHPLPTRRRASPLARPDICSALPHLSATTRGDTGVKSDE